MGSVESEENQWPHHFNMMGELLVGFIFLIAAFFIYMVGLQAGVGPSSRAFFSWMGV